MKSYLFTILTIIGLLLHINNSNDIYISNAIDLNQMLSQVETRTPTYRIRFGRSKKESIVVNFEGSKSVLR